MKLQGILEILLNSFITNDSLFLRRFTENNQQSFRLLPIFSVSKRFIEVAFYKLYS